MVEHSFEEMAVALRYDGEHSPKEDHCPGCDRDGTMTGACPKCGCRTTLLADANLTAAVEPAKVTEFNVGRYCLSEDDCRADGIDFAAYERGIADAAAAFARNAK